MKTVMFLQAFGIGDCIFSQGIAADFIKRGYNVIWPVNQHFVDGLQRAYPKISWVPDTIITKEIFDIKDKRIVDGVEIAPIRWSDSFMKVPYKMVMRAKYDMYNLDWKTWKDHAIWKADPEKGAALMEHLNIKNGDKFNLINEKFGAHSQRAVSIPEINNGFPSVHMRTIEGFSLFDWFFIMNHAVEIHTVSTAILYMLELIPYSKPMHLYLRKPIEKDFSFVDYIFTKPYILHD